MEAHTAHAASTFLGDLALVLVGAAVVGVVFRRLGQPVVLGYLLAGALVGPYIPVPLFADPRRVEALAEFGVVLVMLSIGLEFSVRRLTEVLPRVGIPAMIQMSTLAWLGFLLGRLVGWGQIESVFLGACLAISSTMVVAQTLREVPQPESVRELAVGVLVAQDLVAIMAIAALTAVVADAPGTDEGVLTSTAGQLVLFLLAMLVVGLLLVPRAIRLLTRLASAEMLVVAVAAIAFGLAIVANEMGYSVALGAFLAGALIAESGEGHRIASLVAPIRDLFAAVFFVAIGMSVDPAVALEVAPLGLVVAAIIVLGQLASVGFGGILAGRGLVTSFGAGAALGQVGEFSFIIAAVGVGSGAVRPELASVVVLAALLTAFSTPLVLRRAGALASALDRRLPARVRRLLTLYPSWLDSLSDRARGSKGRSPWRRALAALTIDLIALIGLTWLTALASRPFGLSVARETGLSVEWATGAVIAGAVVLAIPFGVGMVRTAQRLGHALADRALPRRREGPDLAFEPRRAMVTVLEIAILLVAVSLYVTATQPVLPSGSGIVVLGLALFAVVYALGRTSAKLDDHVRAGAQAFAEALLRPREVAELADVGALLPGLGDLTELAVEEGWQGVGRSLAEIDLRGRTGATVLAVRRGARTIELPGADWRIEAGDMLGLTGSHEAIALAREALVGPSASEAPLGR